VSRFEREAQVTSSLQSPHTVELYDFGVSDDGSLFYVMERLHGMDLDEFVRQFGPMPAARVVFVLRQVCASLAEAHQRGLIHRDVKPANIMLCEYALASDFVKMLDFGLVKRMVEDGSSAKGNAYLTEANVVAGTPAFGAPEIYTAKGAIDHRADLYSLGCVAFWLLSGRPVFDEQTPLATLMAHVNTPAPRASVHAESPIPAELDRLISSCLAKDPGERPESAETLLRQLDALHFERPWSALRAREWWLEHRPEAVLS
jgi:serine/threonine-protein kinase